MPIKIVRNDISKMEVDAIVNPTDEFFSGSGGLDAVIHRLAGAKLRTACMELGDCKIGESKITEAYDLNAKYIIHTVGPIWKGGTQSEDMYLRACYSNSLELAKKYNCKSIAFPMISAGTFRYPQVEALKIAMNMISSFILEHEMLVYIVVFGDEAFKISTKLFDDIKEYIDGNYVEQYREAEFQSSRQSLASFFEREVKSARAFELREEESKEIFEEGSELEDIISQIDESFSQMLLRKIDEKGMKDSECYKRANIDRKLFSKIRSDINYRPSKVTAIAFGIALELPLDEFNELLQKAGYALSHSNKFDVIVEYFIKKSKYNIFEINEALFAFDQVLLGV